MATTTRSASPSLNIPAIARCGKAWERAYKLVASSFAAQGKPLDRRFACEQAESAFRDALPPLRGEDNIRDFIACVGYALVKKLMSSLTCEEYFAAAKVALSAVRAQHRPSKSKAC